MTQEKLLEIGDVARALGISRGRAYQLVRLGALPAVRLGRQVRISPSQLAEFIKRGGCTLDQLEEKVTHSATH